MKIHKFVVIWGLALTLCASALAQGSSYRRSRALLIGINSYPQVSNAVNLDYSESDADKVASTLRTYYNFSASDIEVVKGSSANRKGILDALKKSLSGLGREDAILVYFSGHGVSVDDTPYWLAQDSNLDLASPQRTKLRDTAINVKSQVIDEITEANVGHFLLIADNCQSGAIGSLPVIGDIPAGVPLMEIDDVTIARNLSQAAGEILASTGSRDKSFQSDQYRSGRFTKHLIDCLAEYATQRRVFRAVHLFDDVKEKVESETGGKQKPLYRMMPRREGNYMFFSKASLGIPSETSSSSTSNLGSSGIFGMKGYREFIYSQVGSLTPTQVSELEKGVNLWRLGDRTKATPILEKYENQSARARSLLADTIDDYEPTYNKAFRLYLRSAAEGDPYAGGNLAWMYSTGQGVTKDLDQAKMWADAVVKRLESYPDDDWALSMLGDMYQNGYGVSEDRTRARSMMEKAAAKDNSFAVYRLIGMKQTGYGGAEDLVGAFNLAKGYVDRTSSPMVAGRLATMYRKGEGCTKNDDSAFRYAKMAAEGGDQSAAIDLAYYYYYPLGTKQDLDQAIRWAKVALSIGDPDASAYLIEFYYVKGNYAEVKKRIDALGENCANRYWNGVALYRMGEIYEAGLGGFSKSASLAKKYKDLAAKRGYKPAS